MNRRPLVAAAFLFFALLRTDGGAAASADPVRAIVAGAVTPVMKRYEIPGMAVGVVAGGREDVYAFGVASKATRKPVDTNTLFEIGSITKTFTATLASYAQVTGKVALAGYASAYLPALKGTSFDSVTLLELGTHTAGGLPLQLPENVDTDDAAMAYYREWKPAFAPGTMRVYSNPGIMLLGAIAAARLQSGFTVAMQQRIFDPLDLKNTFLDVPDARTGDYAQGYTEANVPIRLVPGPLAPEAYGIRTTAADLLRFVEANIQAPPNLDPALARAIGETHVGYFRVGAMTQDLIWEQYRYPVSRADLLQGNSESVIFQPNPVEKLEPPARPDPEALLDKTGSTNGFGAYVAFVPAKNAGVVILANKSYPIAARVTAAYEILEKLLQAGKSDPGKGRVRGDAGGRREVDAANGIGTHRYP